MHIAQKTPLAINDLQRHNHELQPQLRAAYERVAAGGWYVLGKEVEAFEQEFARYCGVGHAVGVANGTEAIELALRAMGVESGDAVALVANAGGYGAIALAAIGAVPIFVDVDPESHTMDPAALEQALSGTKVKVVIATHLYGRLANAVELRGVASAHGARLVEDCAQSHGARSGGKVAGSFGDAACFSFYPTKNLGALGDGGAVVTGDAGLAASLRKLRQYGWETKYHSTLRFGRNSRLDELQAAFLRVKLPHLDRWNARRVEIARRYCARISHPLVSVPRADADGYVAHLFVVRTSRRDSLRAHLREVGVPHDVHYPAPDHLQVAFLGQHPRPRLPVTEALSQEVLTLPCFPEMTDDEVDAVSAAVNSWSR